MSEERNHAATEQQRQRFRDRGEVARSRELTGAAALIFGVGAMLTGFGASAIALTNLVQHCMGGLATGMEPGLASHIARTFAVTAGPVLGASAVGAAAIGLAQSGTGIRLTSLKFDPSRLNPLPKLQETFASPSTFANLGLSLVKVLVVFAVCVYTAYHTAPVLLSLGPAPLGTVMSATAELVSLLCLRALGAVLLLGLLDYGVTRFKLERKMRMSTQQLKDDMKEANGDPLVRQRRRRMHMEMSRQRSLKAVPTADVVIVNPTHYAVAIAYSPDKMGAPRVVAKGADALAEKIRSIARGASVPVVSQPPLTRLLYRRVKVGKEIPQDLYEAVAVVLSYVYRIRGRLA